MYTDWICPRCVWDVGEHSRDCEVGEREQEVKELFEEAGRSDLAELIR